MLIENEKKINEREKNITYKHKKEINNARVYKNRR